MLPPSKRMTSQPNGGYSITHQMLPLLYEQYG